MVGGQRLDRAEAVGEVADLDRAERVEAGPGRGGAGRARAARSAGVGRVDRDREAAHVEGGHHRRRADDVADAVGDRGLREFVEQHRHLEDRGAAEVVEDDDVRAAGGHEGRELVADHGDGAAGVGVVDLLDAGLAVDAEAELGLALRDAVLLGRARHGAGVERHADRAGAGDDALGGGGDGGEVGAVLGQRAGDLVDEEGAGDAAGLRRCRGGRCRRRR